MTDQASDRTETAATAYAANATRLMALAATLVGPSNAEDVVSEAVLRAIKSQGWSRVENHRAYLTRAVINEAKASYRTSARREGRERRYAMRQRPIGEAEPSSRLLSALASLPLQQRAVIFLTYWADQTPPQVAEELGVAEGTVRKHLARARATLRMELE